MTTSVAPPVAEATPAPKGKPPGQEGGATGGAGWFTYVALGVRRDALDPAHDRHRADVVPHP